MPKKTYTEGLSENFARAVLSVPSPDTEHASVWDRLQAAKKELANAVSTANWALGASPLRDILADHVARQTGRRGQSTLRVEASGDVQLVVRYGEDPAPRTGLPSIAEIRAEAKALGVDPAPFGKAKRKLMAAIAKKRANSKPAANPIPPAAPPQQKAAPKPPPVKPDDQRVVPLDDDDDDGEDLDDLLGGIADKNPDPPPPAATKPAPSAPQPSRSRSSGGLPPVTKTGRSLSDVISSAEDDVDIEGILSKPAPAPPPE